MRATGSDRASPEASHDHGRIVQRIRGEDPRHGSATNDMITNRPVDILSAWTALEVLSPQSFKRESDLVGEDRSLIARFEGDFLPWEVHQKSKPKKTLYYELYFGTIPMEPAVQALLKVYSDSRPERPSVKGHSPIASVILDKHGCPLEEGGGPCISSFAWGVPVALKGDLGKLAEWPMKEKAITAAFRKRLIRRDSEDDIEPLTGLDIQEAYEFLVTSLGLHDLETRAPYFAIKRFEWIGNKKPPEPSLLNSFYLEDLETARSLVATKSMPHALAHFLGAKTSGERTDLLSDVAGLRNLLQPKLTPAGRWTGNGRHPLALLQQAAVNATGRGRMPTGILGVNGPPGTGKTTLLRDVVVARVVERATVMASFDQPDRAFTPSGASLSRSSAKITLHRLDDRLKGFEMVVASSNNKAVENVSRELPALDSVAADAGLRYFKSISDQVVKGDTWGIVAAVLGNASNRYQFSQSFWKDEERGLSTYLNHASGSPQIVVTPQDDGTLLKRLREVVAQEKPPQNAMEAASRWELAREEFRSALTEFRRRQQRIQRLHESSARLAEIADLIRAIDIKLQSDEEKRAEAEAELADAYSKLRKQRKVVNVSRSRAERHVASRPGWLPRLLKTGSYRVWQSRHQDLLTRLSDNESTLAGMKARIRGSRSRMKRFSEANQRDRAKIAGLESERKSLTVAINRSKAKLGIVVPDAEFFGKPHDEVQMLSVWFDKATQIARDRVFVEAMNLHRAFMDCCADAMRQNLSIFLETFGTRSLDTPEKDALIPDLWATFFLAVPVVSTTFASVHRMFSRLKPQSLGWLLVDEAGQAVPQAVVGAMMRTKRTIMVGDPLQIEPVVTLPNSLTEKICSRFDIDPLRFNAPEASAQTLADAASSYCARFPIGSGYRDAGAPLLVHRRCDSPMFDISNEIAYANLMVQAKRRQPRSPVLGGSSWINVETPATNEKWSPREGAVLIGMLRELRAKGGTDDLYVVTPFVVVQDNLRRELLRSGVLNGWTSITPEQWVHERVGTVHTVQGREADLVFFVLGAPAASHGGARAWAGGRPNLLNVAVTRAKTAIYVIGNRANWKEAGHFATLDRFLPR